MALSVQLRQASVLSVLHRHDRAREYTLQLVGSSPASRLRLCNRSNHRRDSTCPSVNSTVARKTRRRCLTKPRSCTALWCMLRSIAELSDQLSTKRAWWTSCYIHHLCVTSTWINMTYRRLALRRRAYKLCFRMLVMNICIDLSPVL